MDFEILRVDCTIWYCFSALIQTLEECSVSVSDILGCGLTEVIAAYVDGALNLDQCLCIAESVGRFIEKFAAENGN